MRFPSSVFVVSILLSILSSGGCGDPPIPPCPDGGTTATYESFGRDFLTARCSWCHAAGAPDRFGAPLDFTFDSLDEVVRRRDRIWARAGGDRPSMPPGPNKPPAAERARLAEWLACGPR